MLSTEPTAPMLAVGGRVWCRSGDRDTRSPRRADASRKASKARARKRAESPVRRAATVVTSDVAETRADASTDDAFSLGCPHFDTCSGCSTSTNLDDFPELRRAREYFARSHDAAFDCATGDVRGWRTRARLAARMVPDEDAAGGEKLALGLFARGSHDLVEIPGCVVQHPRLNDAAALIASACERAGIRAYDETTGEGELRYVQLTAVGADGRADLDTDAVVQVALVWNSPAPTTAAGPMTAPRAIALALKLWNSNSADGPGDIEPPNGVRVHSVWIDWNDAPGNKITGPHWTHLKGERFVWARHGAADVCFTPGSFVQANSRAFDAALERIRSFVFRGAAVSELYAGAGPIGLSIAATMGEDGDDEGSVRCVEIVGAAAETFERSKSKLPEGVGRRVSMAISRAEDACRDAVRDADVVIVDPPRMGLDPRTLTALTGGEAPAAEAGGTAAATAMADGQPEAAVVTEKKPMTRAAKRRARKKKRAKAANAPVADAKAPEEPKPSQPTVKFPAPPSRLSRLIYLSCGFAAFQRDCDALVKSGEWRLTHAEGFNFFPGSDHVETLAVFDREETGAAFWEG